MILFRSILFALLVSMGFGLPSTGRAESAPLKSATLERVGFQGRFKVGQPTPLTVVVETTAACKLELAIETSDPEGHRAVWTDEFEISAAGTHPLSMLFTPGRLETTLRPRVAVKSQDGEETSSMPVLAGDGLAAQLTQQALTQSVLLVATLGDPGGLTEQQVSTGDPNEPDLPEGRVPISVAALNDPSELLVSQGAGQDAAFTNASGLEALDTLVISGQYEMEEVQSEAIRTWVTLGGHLIVAVGQDLESYQNSPLAKWLSEESAGENQLYKLAGVTTFRNLSTLEHFAGKNAAPISINPQNPVKGVRIEPGKNTESLLSVLSGPLVVRGPYGFGTVTFIGLSLNEEPVKSWKSLPSVIRELLWDAKGRANAPVKSQNNQLAYSGITEFATQLHAALQLFRPVDRLSTWTVIGFLAVYLLIIGPLDYFLVHRIFKRPRLTWLTFPILVALAAVIGVGISRADNGEALLTSQVDVLDYDVSTKTLRSRSWLSIYSPESQRYQIALEPQRLQRASSRESHDPKVRMSWFGIPETTFGGMYREGGQSISPPVYQFSSQANRLDNLPIPIWGAKSLTGEWCEAGRELGGEPTGEPQARPIARHNPASLSRAHHRLVSGLRYARLSPSPQFDHRRGRSTPIGNGLAAKRSELGPESATGNQRLFDADGCQAKDRQGRFHPHGASAL